MAATSQLTTSTPFHPGHNLSLVMLDHLTHNTSPLVNPDTSLCAVNLDGCIYHQPRPVHLGGQHGQGAEEESDHDLHAAGLDTLKRGPESHKVNIC